MKRSEMVKIVLDNICGSYDLNEDNVLEVLRVLEDNLVIDPPQYKASCGCCYHSGWEPEINT